MTCGEFRERIDDYMDGLLDDALHARMDAHADGCMECASLLKQASEIKAALFELGDEAPVPAEVSAAWKRAVRLEAERRRRARVWRGWRAFAAAAAALAIWVGATALLGDAGLLDAGVPAEGTAVVASYTAPVEGEMNPASDSGETATYIEADGGGEAVGMLLGSARMGTNENEAGSGSAQPADAVQPTMKTRMVTGQILCQNFDTDLANLDDLVSEVDGYYESETDSEVEGEPVAQRTIRVPLESLDEFLEGLAGLGSPVNLKNYEEDVSQKYSEADARLTTLTAQWEQYNQLIAQASSADEIEELAKNAEAVQAQIDELEAGKKVWDTALQYATVEISLTAGGETAPLGSRMGSALTETMAFLQDMLVALAYLAPAIIGFAIILVAIALVRKSKKTHKGGENT